MQKSISKESIKARLIGGEYFSELLIVLKNVLLENKKGSSLRNRYIIEKYFLGTTFAINKPYIYLDERYGKKQYFNFDGILFPKFLSFQAKANLVMTWLDFIYPYLTNDYSSAFDEGPYLYKNIQIRKGDIVIDAGANLGLFSALASFLGGVVYAFEPVKEIRKEYLEKTIKLNKNIFSIPYGLSNKKELINIKGNVIGDATIIRKRQEDIRNNTINEYIKVIDLDSWIKENNISRIDFIKADIEGAERLMLEGAQWALKTFSPKLSICTYHLPDDKEVLTKLILQANPNYKIEHRWKKLYAWVE
ncbi:MAG: FkbM family methyltransferase [Candidatus Pacebacteria bacterium]|nr:FkbM family methyltransferase [Candidatus Paceibacterota bacterium]MDD5722064.1 FkbM family methyltransferase [Candidatus Paceibacterota bacterium]